MKKYWYNHKFLLMVTLMLGLSSSLLTAGVSLILQQVIDAAVTKDLRSFIAIIVFSGVYILALCLLSYAGSLSSKVLTQRMILQYRHDIFAGIMNHSPGEFHAKNTSEFISSLTNDIKLVEENYLTTVLASFELAVMFVATLALLIWLSPLVTVILILTMLVMFLIPAVLGALLEKRQLIVSKQLSIFTEKLRDFLSGYDVIRSYSMSSYIRKRFDKENSDETDAKLKAARLFALNEGLSDTLSVLSTVTVIFVSAYLVLSGAITEGTLLALVQLSGTFMTPILLLMQNIPKIKSVRPVTEKLSGYAAHVPNKMLGSAEPTFNDSITFDNVSFSYNNRQPALDDISLSLERGKKYAVLGHSGCGKSTLLKLLTGYTDDYSGNIWYDGNELRTLSEEKVSALSSVVHQNVYLFNGTIGENIFLHREFSDSQTAEALESSGVAMFLKDLPAGLDTPVGENGHLLSGGQRQRIALARAMIRNTGLIILDEGTSAIDEKTADEIEDILLSDKKLTVVTVTHRRNSSLLKRYDEIIYMSNGRLVKQEDF